MLLLGDCNHWLKEIKDESIDLICTDPPYGIEFMGKDWDKALVGVETWKECFRVLKQGKLAFVMCSPRQDVLSRMIVNLQDAGFRTNYTSIYWTYASGFPKAANISKLLDKNIGRLSSNTEKLKNRLNELRKSKAISIVEMNKLCGFEAANYFRTDNHLINIFPQGEKWYKIKNILGTSQEIETELQSYFEQAEREIIGKDGRTAKESMFNIGVQKEWNITKPATEEAKKMEGAYVGFQPKPAVEVILVVSKGKTLTWLDDARIPYQSEQDQKLGQSERPSLNNPSGKGFIYGSYTPCDRSDRSDIKGRFPANLLVSDDVLNDGHNYKTGDLNKRCTIPNKTIPNYDSYIRSAIGKPKNHQGDGGSYSRYFSLDAWAKTFPFLIVPKASKSERGEFNTHSTVKPLKLMSYLITMGSREGDLVLDPFCGSGTACIAAHQLHRKWLGIEMNPEYAEIIKKRLADPLAQLKLTAFA